MQSSNTAVNFQKLRFTIVRFRIRLIQIVLLRFLINIPHVGMTSSYALGRDSFTSAGLKRLGSTLSNHII